MDCHDWEILKAAIEEKGKLLMQHEKKDYAQTGMDLSKYQEIKIDERTFYIISTNVFKVILDTHLVQAVNQFPEKFGTRKAEDVIEAIYNIEPWKDLSDFARFLKTENFCWIFELTDGVLNPNVLRVDLFREIGDGEDETSDFIGGVFHAFKHFSYQNTPLSTHAERNDLPHPASIISYIICAFFFEQLEQSKTRDNDFESSRRLNDRYQLKFIFYYEVETKVYFIKTIHKRRFRMKTKVLPN